MFVNRIKLLALSLLVGSVGYSTATYNYATANNCETLTVIRPQFSQSNLNYTNVAVTTLEHFDGLGGSGLQGFMKDEASEIASSISDAPNHEALRKYTHLSKLNKTDRNASFSQMTVEDKSSMWNLHFRINLARHPEWTKQQRAVVLEAIDMVTPALYKAPKDSTWTNLVDEPVRLLTQRALKAFSKQEAAALFSELGFNEQSKSNHAQPPTNRNCACSRESDWCSYQCVSSDCTVLTWGCGTFGIYACDGKCYVPEPK